MPTHAELVTPERVLYSGEADFVVLRTDGGEIMFLPEHAPFIGAVDISVLRIAPPGGGRGGGHEGGSESDGGGAGAHGSGEFRAAVHGGFVHVAANKVTVLASVAEPADEIDVDRARRAAEAARSAGGGEAGERERQPERQPDSQATALPGGEAGQGGEGRTAGEAEESATLRAMLYPDQPDVALRRAEVRLEAAGAEIPGGASGSGGGTTGTGS